MSTPKQRIDNYVTTVMKTTKVTISRYKKELTNFSYVEENFHKLNISNDSLHQRGITKLNIINIIPNGTYVLGDWSVFFSQSKVIERNLILQEIHKSKINSQINFQINNLGLYSYHIEKNGVYQGYNIITYSDENSPEASSVKMEWSNAEDEKIIEIPVENNIIGLMNIELFKQMNYKGYNEKLERLHKLGRIITFDKPFIFNISGNILRIGYLTININ